MMSQQQIDPERDAAISKAMAALPANVAQAQSDPNRPAFHYRAPANWMNDPNGPIYYNGWYHVFYQFNPYGDHWGNMHWGHTRSRDLVNWQDLPVALWPTKSREEEHIYSGSTFLAPGPLGLETPTAFYTSISEKRQPEQWSAFADDRDLIHWTKTPQNPVLTSNLQEWRDPFLFSRNGKTYLITGGGEHDRGVVALYSANDATLHNWTPQGILFHDPDQDVRNIECPNFAEVDGKWVLLISVQGRVEYFVGSLDDSMRLAVESRGVLAEGSYASQLVHDKNGKVVHLAWVPTDDHHGWNGFLTLPSILSIAPDGKLQRNPVPALTKLRTETYSLSRTPVSGVLDLSPHISGDLLEIEAKVEFKGAKEFGIRVRRSAGGSRSQTLKYEATADELELHLFIDKGVVDQYLNHGLQTKVIKFAAKTEDTGIALFATGGAVQIKTLRIHRLKPATFEAKY
jgi:beta-fructofuranosidase